jgi:hypothetical protein
MAKKSVSDKQYRQMMSARQERRGGKFGPLKPEFKAPKQPPIQIGNAPATDAAVAQQIGFLQALIRQRKTMGMETSELENYVIGTADKQGVRSVVENFIAENRKKFDQDDPAGAAAYQLMKEAVVLSEGSLKASMEDAKLIYARLRFIRELAKKTEGEQSAIAAKLDEIIKPVEDQLKKRTSFGEFLKEKAQTFKKTLPERLAAKVPVIGGLLSGFLKERRETQEDIEKYSGSLQESISRRGRKTSELDIDELGGGGRSIAARLGATRASDIPGMDLGGTGKGIPSTLGAIYKEITKIRTLIENKFAPTESDSAEIKAREAELEGKGGGKASEKAVKMVVGEKGGGGFMSDFMANLLGSGLGSALMKGISALGPMIMGAIGAIGPALMAAIAGLGTAIAGIGSMLLTVAIPALVATVGAAIGGGLAWLINSGIDAIFGTNLSELMFDKDTYTLGDVDRENKRAAEGKAADARIQAQQNTPEYIAAMSQDPRMLPKLISDKKITGSQGLDILSSFEQKNGSGEDTDAIRAKILEMDPSAVGSAAKNGSFAAVNAAQSATAAATIPSVTTGSGYAVTSDQSTTVGVLSASTPNTTAGKMLSQYSAEQAALNNAQAAGSVPSGGTVNNSSVNTRVSNVVNNFNDDLRIRNNEPTQKQMQTFSLVP